jgi:hypothetical protein
VEDGEIKWPGPGSIKDPVLTQYGQNPYVFFAPGTGTITPEILLEVSLQTASVIDENGGWTVTITTTNKGRQRANNLTAELHLNPDFFEVLSTLKQKSTLAFGDQWTTTFDVLVKENAYGKEHLLVAEVTFSSTYGETTGTFLAREELLKPIAEKPEPILPSLPEFLLDPITLVLLICLAAVIGTLTTVIARR